ncbi:MAG: alpha/beta hydrolase family protein, partial [Anaerolineae bacterium]|nr:alpha/beta hydrolase family protein [Anaerolineae bacterium]
MTDFGLQGHVDFLYDVKPRQLAFRARTVDEFTLWQAELRAVVRSLLGIAGRVLPAAPAAERVQLIDRGAYIEEKYALDVGEQVRAPMYVLVPKTPPPYKPIMTFHGHVPSIQYLLGQYPDDATAAERLAVDENYAQRLAEDGYLVCAVEQRGFGERITDQMANGVNSCRHLAFAYLMQGRSLVGARVWDGMVAISYMLNRPDVVPGILGCTGHSGGGTTALWLSALDERVQAAVVQSYFCSFKGS